MSYVKIWIHAVWATKNRQAILNQDVRGKDLHRAKSHDAKIQVNYKLYVKKCFAPGFNPVIRSEQINRL